jgi:hypothetical protein
MCGDIQSVEVVGCVLLGLISEVGINTIRESTFNDLAHLFPFLT